MAAIPRYRPHRGPVILSAGFRPFFLLSGLWAAIAIPLWLSVFAGEAAIPTPGRAMGRYHLLDKLVWDASVECLQQRFAAERHRRPVGDPDACRRNRLLAG